MNSRNISLDLLKVILAIFIVLLHCNFFNEYNKIINFLTVQGVFRISVPIFFLINGYFFSYVIESKKIKKWIIRVLKLYSVWMIIYLPIWFTSSIEWNIIYIVFGYHHLWYINSMLISGIFLFKISQKSKNNKLILAFTLFLIGVIIQYLVNYEVFELNILKNINTDIYIYRNFLFVGVPFFTIGHLIKINNWHKIMTLKQTKGLLFLGSILLLLESYLNYCFTGKGFDILFSLVIICPVIFIYALNSNVNYNIKSKNISLISTAIYLIHPWIMEILMKFNQFNSIFLALLTIIISFIVSVIIIKIDSKIKILL